MASHVSCMMCPPRSQSDVGSDGAPIHAWELPHSSTVVGIFGAVFRFEAASVHQNQSGDDPERLVLCFPNSGRLMGMTA